MSLMPISSGITRASICPSVSSDLNLRPAALQQRAAALRQLQRLAHVEAVEVRDDDLRALDVAEHVGRDQLAAW